MEFKWRHLNFFQHDCMIRARVPRTNCPDHGVKRVTVPWAREGSGFAVLFEQAAMVLVRDFRVRSEFEYYMPQTKEYLRGRMNFTELNNAYPAGGKWKFSVHSIVTDGKKAVSDVSISDGVRYDRAITFHTIRNNLIWRQIEYWPDDYSGTQLAIKVGHDS